MGFISETPEESETKPCVIPQVALRTHRYLGLRIRFQWCRCRRTNHFRDHRFDPNSHLHH